MSGYCYLLLMVHLASHKRVIPRFFPRLREYHLSIPQNPLVEQIIARLRLTTIRIGSSPLYVNLTRVWYKLGGEYR